MPKIVNYLNASQFADALGVSRQAVSKAIQKGKVLRGKNGINPEHLKNKAYAARILENSGNQQQVKFAKAVGKAAGNDLSNYEEEAVRNFSEGKDETNKHKQFQTKVLQLKIAREMKELIPRSYVEKFFGRVAGVMETHFIHLGERIASNIAGICEITDPDKKLQIQHEIEKEIIGGLGEVKSQAEAFSKSISELF